jgi:hypothetical protein
MDAALKRQRIGELPEGVIHTRPGYEERMVYRGGLRGNLDVILNRMVQEDVIAGFRTNLSDLLEPKRLTVTIFPQHGEEPGAAVRRVKRALTLLGTHIDVVADCLRISRCA